MKKIFTVTALVFFGLISHAQSSDYQFAYLEKELLPVESSIIKKHYLGEGIAAQMQLMKETYTYKTDGLITNTETTVIEKPSIFNSVNKVNKYLKKCIKTGEMTESEAEVILTKALKVTLNIRYQDTQILEEELWKLKDPKEITYLYTDRIQLGI